jgi:hypothetical protein
MLQHMKSIFNRRLGSFQRGGYLGYRRTGALQVDEPLFIRGGPCGSLSAARGALSYEINSTLGGT